MARGAICPQCSNVEGWVGVAGNTGRGRAFEYAVLMTLFTTHLDMRPIQFECEQIMINRCGVPIIRGMASRAICAKRAVMFVILLMTGVAILGSAFEHVVHMAIFALPFRMSTFQLEDRQIMVKLRRLPAIG